jgi:hypothetical protein
LRTGAGGPGAASAASIGPASGTAGGVCAHALEPGEDRIVRQVQAGGVGAQRSVEVGGQRDGRMGAPDFAVRRGLAQDGGRRILHQRLERDAGVRHAVDERGVGAVLQQAPHQVGEQRLVGAHRRVDPARNAQAARVHAADHLLVQRFAHAVQAVEFVPARRPAAGPGHPVDRRDGMGVVGRELRVDRIRRAQQLPGAGEVGHIGVRLAGEDGIALQAVDLRPLDLGVPVGALDEAHHDAAAVAPRQVDHEIDHRRAPLLVGLDHEAQAVPARELRRGAQALQQVQRQLQAIRLLGVDVEPDAVPPRLAGQLQQHRVELVHHPRALGPDIARMQGGELDGDAGPVVDAAAGGRFADGVDRRPVVAQVARRVVGGQSRLAQHVVGMAEALRLARSGVRQRFGDGLASDELLAHQPHRPVDRGADQRLAAPADQPSQRGRQARPAGGGDQPAGDHQPPGRSVDEQRVAPPQVPAPVAGCDLVADQGVAGGGVRDAQQRFGQAHERDPFLRRQGVFLEQALHQPGAAAVGPAMAQALGEAQGQPLRRRGIGGRLLGTRQEVRDRLRFRDAGGRGDGGPQGRRAGRQIAHAGRPARRGFGRCASVHGDPTDGCLDGGQFSADSYFLFFAFCRGKLAHARIRW